MKIKLDTHYFVILWLLPFIAAIYLYYLVNDYEYKVFLPYADFGLLIIIVSCFTRWVIEGIVKD